MQFKLNPLLFNQFPDLQVGVIVCHHVDNLTPQPEIRNLYFKTARSVHEKFSGIELSTYPVVAQWREAYKSFGEKKCRSSVEALIRRVTNGHEIPSINPLVDIYNIISLKHEVPCGGEDLGKITSDLELTYATGTEQFVNLNTTEVVTVKTGEIVYKFDQTVICRSFNYHESDITKLTPNTTDCVLVIEDLSGNHTKLTAILFELKTLVEQYLKADCSVHIMDKKAPSFSF